MHPLARMHTHAHVRSMHALPRLQEVALDYEDDDDDDDDNGSAGGNRSFWVCARIDGNIGYRNILVIIARLFM